MEFATDLLCKLKFLILLRVRRPSCPFFLIKFGYFENLIILVILPCHVPFSYSSVMCRYQTHEQNSFSNIRSNVTGTSRKNIQKRYQSTKSISLEKVYHRSRFTSVDEGNHARRQSKRLIIYCSF